MSRNKRNVLILTYYWPPSGGAGVQRWLKFTKYLPEFGWNPIVITVANGTYPHKDTSLQADVSDDVEVYKTKTLEPFGVYNRLLLKKDKSVSAGLTGIKDSKNPVQRMSKFIRANYFVPDARKGWNHYAYKKAAEIIKNREIDLIITTGPPHSTHLTGLKLKRKFEITWLVDLRDPWTGVFYNKLLPRTEKTKKKDKRLEQSVLNTADCITAVGENFKLEFPEHASKMHVVYNGYDASDMTSKISGTGTTEHFKIAYIGNFKPNQDVPVLWNVLSEMVNMNEEFKEHFRLHFVGKIDDHILNKIKSSELGNNLILEGFVSHSEAVEKMNNTNLLLFVIPLIDNNNLIITGKIFEYLASGSAVLPIGPTEGEAGKILESCNRDNMLDYSDENGMRSLIKSYFDKWIDTKAVYKYQDQSYERFTREEQTKTLSDIMNRLIND